MGDVHGQADALKRVLRDAGLIDPADRWSGGNTTLWFTGDFFDRGPDGLAAVDLVMRLQAEAQPLGGAVKAVLGNHDVLILAARHFSSAEPDGEEAQWAEQFTADWLLNGGWLPDLHGLTPRHVRWLTHLPALAKLHGGRVLLAHADSTFYLEYGRTVATVNRAVCDVLTSDSGPSWERLLVQFCERRAFGPTRADGAVRATEFLKTFQAERLIHGHTPISLLVGRPAGEVTAPLVYADGRCVNVDAGLFLGSPGFLFDVPPEWVS